MRSSGLLWLGRAHLRLLDLDEMAHGVQHAARLRRVRDLDGVPDAAQAERAQRGALCRALAPLCERPG